MKSVNCLGKLPSLKHNEMSSVEGQVRSKVKEMCYLSIVRKPSVTSVEVVGEGRLERRSGFGRWSLQLQEACC